MTITSAGSSANLAQLRQLQQSAFKTADADGDGQLSLTEFQSIGQNVQGADGQKGPPPMRGGRGPGGHFSGDTLSSLLSTQSVDDLTGSLMKAGDTDGDGKMSVGELSSALAANAPQGAPTGEKAKGIEDKMASDIMSALDTDGDGSLSSSEISTAITTAAANESSAQATRGPHGHHGGPPPAGAAGGASGSSGVFESLDTNKDGTVSAEELAAANSTDSTSGANAASDLIKTADQDGDRTLSGGEFAAMLDQGKTTATDSTSALASLMSGSTAAADLMQKLLAQLDKAMTTSSASSSGTVSSGTNVTA